PSRAATSAVFGRCAARASADLALPVEAAHCTWGAARPKDAASLGLQVRAALSLAPPRATTSSFAERASEPIARRSFAERVAGLTTSEVTRCGRSFGARPRVSERSLGPWTAIPQILGGADVAP